MWPRRVWYLRRAFVGGGERDGAGHVPCRAGTAATIYRQALFAEFELLAHEAAEKGTPLTAEFLAITGGIDRHPDGDHLAAAAGIDPVRRQSGKVSFLRPRRHRDNSG